MEATDRMASNKKVKKKSPSWSDVKAVISGFDKQSLMVLISDLYSFSSENKKFFHSRFYLVENPLEPYKKVIEDSLYPDICDNEQIKISKAKKAISDYSKATGDPKGILELMVFFVECGNRFTLDYGDIDEDFYLALEGMYANAIENLLTMDEETLSNYIPRLEEIMESSDGIGWGYHDSLTDIFYEAFTDYSKTIKWKTDK